MILIAYFCNNFSDLYPNHLKMQIQRLARMLEQGVTWWEWLFPFQMLQRSTSFRANLPQGKALKGALRC